GNAYARRVEQLENRAVAFAKISFHVGRFDEANGIFNRQVDRKFLFFARRGNDFGRVRFGDAFAHEELKEGAQRGELARDRSLPFLIRVQRRQPFANGQVVDLRERWFFALTVFIRRRNIIDELPQVAFVISYSVRANVALVT